MLRQLSPLFDHAAYIIRRFRRVSTAFMSLRLVRLHNQGLPMPDVDANGRYGRTVFVSLRQKRARDEEIGHKLGQRSI